MTDLSGGDDQGAAPGAPAPETTAQRPWAPPLTALRALFLITLHHGCQLSPEQLAAAQSEDLESSVLRALRDAGFEAARTTQCSWDDVTAIGGGFPALAIMRDGSWQILAGILGQDSTAQVAMLDPAREALGITLLAREAFCAQFSGTILLCRRAAPPAEEKFGLSWFAREILRHGGLLRDVTIAALLSLFITLCTPLLYHVLIDRVIPFHAETTLVTVLVVFTTVTLFDAAFTYGRARLMLTLTNKVDAALASRTFAKLLSLPVAFFERTPAGVLTRHMQQTEKLRHFLTGRLFQCALDSIMLPPLLVLLMAYSFRLTLLVLAFALVIAALIFLLIPHFRVRLAALYQAEGGRQAQLVEALHGMRTVKSLALEPARQAAWADSVAAAIGRQNEVGQMAAAANTLTGTLDKFTQIAVVGLGANEVFAGRMSIGALVAFTMLASRVSGPLLQIVGLINEYQETALSVRMLGSIMDHPPERPAGAARVRPALTGALSFDMVSFRYEGAAVMALDRVSFAAERGQVIGVVGRSGSGKTTLTRLIQGIEAPQSGLIRFDGVDIRHIDLEHLRRHVGVVLQESFLFRGTIHDNIVAGRPGASFADVVRVAHLAGADEFIDRLPLGYETRVEEGAANYSGGQRQRLSIARALLGAPELLIFDEATSALDPESEALVQANLARIAAGRTMIIVSHRLASLVQADRILVLEHGQAVDFAPHGVLLERCAPYRALWQQQTRHMFAA